MPNLQDMENAAEDKAEGGSETGESMGHNAGKGNRAVAQHIKALHAAAGHSGNSVSSMIAPSKTLIHPPGAKSSVLKTPHSTTRPLD